MRKVFSEFSLDQIDNNEENLLRTRSWNPVRQRTPEEIKRECDLYRRRTHQVFGFPYPGDDADAEPYVMGFGPCAAYGPWNTERLNQLFTDEDPDLAEGNPCSTPSGFPIKNFYILSRHASTNFIHLGRRHHFERACKINIPTYPQRYHEIYY
jgi:hypothetical protein